MELVILSGSAHPTLAKQVALHSGRELGVTHISRFADRELNIQIGTNVRHRHAVIIQPTFPPGDHWLELFLLIDAARRGDAERITALMPYYGYARQDRKDKPRKPISAALMAHLLISAGASRLCTIDLHSAQTQGAILAPFDNLHFSFALLQALPNQHWVQTVLVSPDAGGLPRCRALAKRFGCPIAFIDKRREQANQSEVMNVVGEVNGLETVIIDDLIDTAGSLVHSASALLEKGARKVLAVGTHALFSPKSLPRLATAPIDQLVVSDSIPISARKCRAIGSKLNIVSCAQLLGQAILRIHNGDSLSSLFD